MNLPSEPVLITGAAGFLGRHVLREFAALGIAVTGLTRRDCDLADAESVRRLLADVPHRVIVHLAARIPAPGREDAELMFSDNVLATIRLVENAPDCGHFVFASTLDVYGSPECLPIREASYTEPFTSYGILKLAAEKFARSLCRSRGIPCCILRFTHLYGPGDQPIKLIPKSIAKLSRGELPELWGDGSDLRDYLHVRDAARAVVAAVRRRTDSTINIATGQSLTILQVLKSILKCCEVRDELVVHPRAQPKIDYRFDISRMKATLGFEAQEDFQAGLSEMWRTCN